MRKTRALNLPHFTRKEERRTVRRRWPHRRSYFCSYCSYESTRQYNVTRHEERIHATVSDPRTCCGVTFPTKGEYYLHCEKYHPEKRSNATVSRIKYKILADMIMIRRKHGHAGRPKLWRNRRRRSRFVEEDETENEDETEEEEEEEMVMEMQEEVDEEMEVGEDDDTEDVDEEEEEENENEKQKQRKKDKEKQKKEKERRRAIEENRRYMLRRRFSERIRQKDTETRAESELTFQCSITYRGLDRENIPLACFLNDRALRKACHSSTPVVNPSAETTICNDTVRSTKKFDDPCESISDTTTMATTMMTTMTTENTVSKDERSWKEEEEGEYSRNEGDSSSSVLESLEFSRRWTSLSESSSSSFVGELPTKKLILRRFMTTMDIKIENTPEKRITAMPLQERHQNVYVSPQSTRLIKNCKRAFVSSSSSSYAVLDKENIPNMEEKVMVQLDNSITLPVVTKLHRDFLSSIDFDSL